MSAEARDDKHYRAALHANIAACYRRKGMPREVRRGRIGEGWRGKESQRRVRQGDGRELREAREGRSGSEEGREGNGRGLLGFKSRCVRS